MWDMFVLRLPGMPSYTPRVLTAMEDSGLGFVQVDLNCVLRIWSMKISRIWVIIRAINLKTMKLGFSFVFSPCVTVAFGDGAGVIFLKRDGGLYSFDLKSLEVIKVYMSSAFYDNIPYMSFYTTGIYWHIRSCCLLALLYSTSLRFLYKVAWHCWQT